MDTDKKRLFVDMDGTLAVFTPVTELEALCEKGYFANAAPHENVIEAVKQIVDNQQDVEVFILSAYLIDSNYALPEKNEWLDKYLPSVDAEHRIFMPCGCDKNEYVPDGIKDSDYLLDDYTSNLIQWEQGGGRGIKLLNGINHTRGTWEHDRIRYDKNPTRIADDICDVISNNSRIFDEIINDTTKPTDRDAGKKLSIRAQLAPKKAAPAKAAAKSKCMALQELANTCREYMYNGGKDAEIGLIMRGQWEWGVRNYRTVLGVKGEVVAEHDENHLVVMFPANDLKKAAERNIARHKEVGLID